MRRSSPLPQSNGAEIFRVEYEWNSNGFGVIESMFAYFIGQTLCSRSSRTRKNAAFDLNP
ncbi:hypothetical protein SAMN05192563_100714 [Paraburkholderia aspalathi]|uniref:Uncharacterized protein n=1 Tax=Paraburkholderia aspalathi TaxID=1324617 RepID=A0A1I7CM32_9BURK|nr:hypothetical protein SAMN05192563_100714 [Paraburkholderia aspalathi]